MNMFYHIFDHGTREWDIVSDEILTLTLWSWKSRGRYQDDLLPCSKAMAHLTMSEVPQYLFHLLVKCPALQRELLVL